MLHSVGGGGSSSARKIKLRAKNEKLHQERTKRTLNDRAAPNVEFTHVVKSSHIHPSRLSMVTDQT